MPARRFFVEGNHAAGDRIALRESDAHKVLHVLRLHDGDALEIVDAGGTAFDATVERDGDGVLAALVSARTEEPLPGPRIDLAQAVPKGTKMDYVVEKATELGVSSIVPFYSERSVVHDAGSSKVDRWRRIAIAAAQQSARNEIPKIEEPLSYTDLLDRFSSYDAVIFAWEHAEQIPPRERLPELLEGTRRVLTLVGPEGGFSQYEADLALARGAHELWLGHRILRSETAPIALLAMIAYAAT